MRASVFGFRKVEAEEGCVVAELPEPALLRLMKEYEQSPWWLRLSCHRSHPVQGFAMSLFLEAPFPLQSEQAFKDGFMIEEQERQRFIEIQSRGGAWWEASLFLSEAFSDPGQGVAGFSTLEAVFSGGRERGQTAFRILYRINMRELRCEVEVRYRGAQLIQAVLSKENAQWGWDVSLGKADGVKVATVASAPSEDIPFMELILAADVEAPDAGGGPAKPASGGGRQRSRAKPQVK
jgi:hypothetical protein